MDSSSSSSISEFSFSAYPGGGESFPTTVWSKIVAGEKTESGSVRHGLEHLCEAYWQPLYAYARQLGATQDEASDQVQGFFVHVVQSDVMRTVERGETLFRNFLRTRFRAWLKNSEHDDQRRGLKLQESVNPRALALPDLERSLNPDDDPETAFDRQWARSAYTHAVRCLEEELSQKGRPEFYRDLRTRAFSGGSLERLNWKELAERYQLSAEAVRKAAFDLRQLFAKLLRREVRRVVGREADVEEELRYLGRLMRD